MELFFRVRSDNTTTYHKLKYNTYDRNTISEFEQMLKASNKNFPNQVFEAVPERCLKRLLPASAFWRFQIETEHFQYYTYTNTVEIRDRQDIWYNQ